MRRLRTDRMHVGDEDCQRRDLERLGQSVFLRLLERVAGVVAPVGKRDHIGAGRLRLQQERREIRGIGRMSHRTGDLATGGLHDA